MTTIASRPLHIIERALPHSQVAGAHGVAKAADAMGDRNGVLTKEELDAYEPVTSRHEAVAQLRQVLDLPAVEPLNTRALTAPRIETRTVPGEAFDWFDISTVRTSDPALFKAGKALHELIMTGAAPDELEHSVDLQESPNRRDIYRYDIQRDLVQWGLDNIEAFYEWDVVPTSRSPLELKGDLERLLAAIDGQGDPQSVKVGVLPPEFTETRLPGLPVKVELVTEVQVGSDRPTDSQMKSWSKHYFAVHHDDKHNVILNVTPAARGPGQASEPFETVVTPEDQGVNRLPRPRFLDQGVASIAWVQVVDRSTGEVVANKRYEIPAQKVPKINVDLRDIDHWEDTSGRNITIR